MSAHARLAPQYYARNSGTGAGLQEALPSVPHGQGYGGRPVPRVHPLSVDAEAGSLPVVCQGEDVPLVRREFEGDDERTLRGGLLVAVSFAGDDSGGGISQRTSHLSSVSSLPSASLRG